MGDSFWHALVAVATAITGVALVAVIVSKNSQAPQVIQSAASGFGNSLDVAVSPVTGSSAPPSLSYPGSGSGPFVSAFAG